MDASRDFFFFGGGGGALPDFLFLFFSLFVGKQQTTTTTVRIYISGRSLELRHLADRDVGVKVPVLHGK